MITESAHKIFSNFIKHLGLSETKFDLTEYQDSDGYILSFDFKIDQKDFAVHSKAMQQMYNIKEKILNSDLTKDFRDKIADQEAEIKVLKEKLLWMGMDKEGNE